MENQTITSLQNPLVKKVIKLIQKPAERKKEGLFVVEGVREIFLMINAGFTVNSLFLCERLYQKDKDYLLEPNEFSNKKILVSPEVFDKMAYRGNSGGVLALVESKYTRLDELKLSDNPLIVVLESVEKPGNLGAILRTADAAGVDAVVICDHQTDIYNPNVIRSSLGCVFSVPVVVCNKESWFRWADDLKITTAIASVQAKKSYFASDLTRPIALAFGTEADGLTKYWYENSSEHLVIPMAGKIDSLNVSASAAIMIFEAVRQRSCEKL
jgi:TrmH family RNA methyltransferase